MDISAIDRYDDALKDWRDVEAECVRRIADAKALAIEAQQKAIKSLPADKLVVLRALSGNFYVSDKGTLRKADDVIVSAEDAEPVEP